MLDLIFKYEDLIWQSDWNGYEVGYEEVSVVGLYRLDETDLNFYIDMSNGEVLEYWQDEHEIE